MLSSKAIRHALISGALASSASLVGKLSLSSAVDVSHYSKTVGLSSESMSALTSLIVYSIRAALLVLMVLINALMWTQFTKALNSAPDSVQVFVVNTAANFLLSAFYGKVVFSEALPLFWWFGTSLIILGLILMKNDLNIKSD